MNKKIIIPSPQEKETIKKLVKEQGFYQYNKVTDALLENGYYVHNSEFIYQSVYYWSGKEIITLCSRTKYWRAQRLLLALQSGKINKIEDIVIDNYANNGYSTRAGLFRSKPDKDKLQKIARSHLFSDHSLTGEENHNIRVKIRK